MRSDDVEFVVVGEPEDVVEIAAPSDGETLDMATFTVSGTANPGASVIDGEEVGAVTADDEGNWTIEVTTTNGAHDITATNGDASSAVSVTVADDSLIDEITVAIDSPVEGDEVDLGTAVVVEGQATELADIEVIVDGEVVGTTKAGREGYWRLEVEDLEAGEHTVEVTATLGDKSATAGPVTFVVVDASDAVDVLLVGGCAQSGNQPMPAPGLEWFGLLALLGLARARRQ